MGNIEHNPDAIGQKFMAKVESCSYVPEQSQPGPVLVTLADVQAKPIDWIWPGVLARGKITILSSNPGCGKSTLTIDMSARLSEGKPWPVIGGNAQIGSTIFLTAEDDIADTVRPRFDLAGGDPAKVKILQAIRDNHSQGQELKERSLDLTRDLLHVEQAIDQTPDCVLMVIDPINAYIGGVDSHKDSALRGGVLTPLQALAGKKKISILLVSHLRKSGGKAILRTLGSIGFIGAARIAFGIVKDSNNPDRRIMICQKSNIWRDNLGFAYSLIDCGGFARVEWEPDLVTQSADEIFQAEDNDQVDTDDTDMLIDSVLDILAGGVAKSFADIKEAVKEQAGSVGNAKLRKAIHKAGAKKNRDGYRGPVTWRIPPDG